MSKRKHNSFDSTARLNNLTYDYYYRRLMNIAVSTFEWKNLPDTIDPRFLELQLYTKGRCIFFKDEDMGDGEYLSLACTLGGTLNVYNIPTERTAYASNGYQRKLNEDNSVVIFHNYLHTSPAVDIDMYALRLQEIQRTIDVNVHAQKTPVIVLCDENQRLSMVNLMMNYEGNVPLIFGDKHLNPNDIKSINIEAPFVAKELEELRVQTWNDALTYLGISNVNVTKKERLITDEVQRNMGGTLASRYSPLDMRQQACKQINDMFGLNISVDYREDLKAYDKQIVDETDDGGDELNE